ncbi:hypothetical protein [Corynebacterium matruchotii]|uniref:hypothetical protein n=1 Tax=Corynebacterium matruchotii TaxID=43768 RepID=UPI00288075F3|nr:hypothetical protein [Corynebacterium matruchotii]
MLRTCAALHRSRPTNYAAAQTPGQAPDRALNIKEPRAQRVAWARGFSIVASS